MATDFFDRQDHARRQTARLLVMFALAVVAIILAIYLVAVLGAAGVEQDHARGHAIRPPSRASGIRCSSPGSTLGTLLVVGLGSLYKIAELSAGGEQIALMLGGRAVNPQTTDLAERRLLNVVEEMALASGIPVPPVYVLDHEPGINAFAAGHQPGDAVVAVSAGCLQYLTREELQGVMGHEFSHILNGDMRLNLRLIGIVYGILVLAILGYYVMRIGGSLVGRLEGRRRRRRVLPLRPGAADPRLPGRVLRQADQERHQPAARVPGRRLVGPVHAQPGRNRRGAEEDRRPGRGLADSRRPRRGNQPHVLRRRLCRLVLQSLRHASAAGRAHPGVGAGVRRPVSPRSSRWRSTAEAVARAAPAQSGRCALGRVAGRASALPAARPCRRRWRWMPGTWSDRSAGRRRNTCSMRARWWTGCRSRCWTPPASRLPPRRSSTRCC